MHINWPPLDAPLETLEVRLLSLPLRSRLAASHDKDPNSRRELVIVKVTDSQGRYGWGECSALASDSYWPETARSSFETLSKYHLGSGPTDDGSTPMAAAALEMAALDLWLTINETSLADYLDVDRATIPAGAVVGLGRIADVVEEVRELVEAGFMRVKLKIMPGHDVDVVHAVRVQWPDLEIQVDANGSYGPSGLAVMYRLKALGVNIFEQPFDWQAFDIAPTRRLIKAGATVVADESMVSLESMDWYYEVGATSAVTIKSGRSGGISAAKAMSTRAAEMGLGVAAGGMLESGLGRHVLVALAGGDEFTITGDVSPARRWLAEDPWPDIEMRDGEIPMNYGWGVAPAPDEDMIEAFTVKTAHTEATDSTTVRSIHRR